MEFAFVEINYFIINESRTREMYATVVAHTVVAHIDHYLMINNVLGSII